MITLNVNGEIHDLEVDPTTPLLWIIREQIGLIGTKFGCGIAQCGACTVHLNGAPIRSCVGGRRPADNDYRRSCRRNRTSPGAAGLD